MGPAGNIFDIIRGIHLAGIGGYTKAKSQLLLRCGGLKRYCCPTADFSGLLP